MKKSAFFLTIVAVVILPVVLCFLSGCVSTPTKRGNEWEPWAGEMTGMISADLKMFFSRLEEGTDVYVIEGNFEGEIDASGDYGRGKMRAKLKGKVKDGICNIDIWGTVVVEEGSATINGKMIGTLSKTQAFGSWTLVARDDERYDFSGEWSAQKTDDQ